MNKEGAPEWARAGARFENEDYGKNHSLGGGRESGDDPNLWGSKRERKSRKCGKGTTF